jgi:hypothetical protein
MTQLTKTTNSHKVAARQMQNTISTSQMPVNPPSVTAQKPRKNVITINDINIDCTVRFRIDKQLAKQLELDEWVTFKELVVGMLRYNKKVGDFYDKKTSSFNAYKYPFFTKFFPDCAMITNTEIKKYLIAR